MAKALLLRKQMQICDELKVSNVIFGGDCLPVVNAVVAEEASWLEMGPIIHNVYHMLL